MAYKVFTNGSVLQASEINDNLMNQAVIAFTNSTSRASAITSPVEGMVTYLEDTNVHEFWNGSAWVALAAGIRNPVDTTNTAAGTDALNPSTTGTANTAFGRDALKANTTGNKNVSVGAYALDANTTGTGNVALGWSSAGATTTGNGNVAIGEEALLVNTTGGNNVSIGPRSMRAITTAGINVAVGDGAAYSLTTGTESVALGSYALYANTTGNYNTALGSAAGNANTTGSNNTTVGYNAQTSTTTVSNQITLGSNGVTSLRCNVTSISSLSDGRDKSNVKDSELGLDLVNKLRPVTFDWDRRDGSMSGVKDVGFIAQEVIEVEDDLEIFDTLRMSLRDNDEKYEVAPARLIPVLTKAIQELSKQNDDLMARLEKLENK